MKSAMLCFCLVAFCMAGAFGSEAPSVETSASGDSREVVSPPKSAYPGKKWRQRTFQVKNTGNVSFYVHGHSLDHVFVQLFTKNPATEEFESRGMGYCGTGAGFYEVKAGQAFTVTVTLPIEQADRDFHIEFAAYPNGTGNDGKVVRTQILRMKDAE